MSLTRFPDNTKTITIIGNGTRTSSSPPITLNLLNCDQLEALNLEDVGGVVTVYAPEHRGIKFNFSMKSLPDNTIELHQFPRILGTVENGYSFLSMGGYHYFGDEYQNWRSDTLIENPEDHHLYPLLTIGLNHEPTNMEFYKNIIVPKTVQDISTIDCSKIKHLDLSSCTSLNFVQNMISLDLLFFQHPDTMSVSIPEHWMTQDILIQFTDSQIMVDNVIVIDNVISLKNKILDINSEGTFMTFRSMQNDHVVLYSDVLEEVFQEYPRVMEIYIPGENYIFSSFNITIPVYVDTNTMKQKLLEINSMAEVITLEELLKKINILEQQVESLKSKFDEQGLLSTDSLPDLSSTYAKLDRNQKVNPSVIPSEYITNSSLNTTLKDYVTSASLTNTLSHYAFLENGKIDPSVIPNLDSNVEIVIDASLIVNATWKSSIKLSEMEIDSVLNMGNYYIQLGDNGNHVTIINGNGIKVQDADENISSFISTGLDTTTVTATYYKGLPKTTVNLSNVTIDTNLNMGAYNIILNTTENNVQKQVEITSSQIEVSSTSNDKKAYTRIETGSTTIHGTSQLHHDLVLKPSSLEISVGQGETIGTEYNYTRLDTQKLLLQAVDNDTSDTSSYPRIDINNYTTKKRVGIIAPATTTNPTSVIQTGDPL